MRLLQIEEWSRKSLNKDSSLCLQLRTLGFDNCSSSYRVRLQKKTIEAALSDELLYVKIGKLPMSKRGRKNDNYLEVMWAINNLKHESLAHNIFQHCFAKGVKSKEIRGFKKASLFRMALAYFLLVPNAREKFVFEVKEYLQHQM
jgi:hypothetical protein